MGRFSELEYKRVSYEETAEKVHEQIENLKNADSSAAALAAFFEAQALFNRIYSANTTVYIRYTMNTKDAFYAAEREYYDECEPLISELLVQMGDAVLASPFIEEIKKVVGEVYIRNLELQKKAFSPEIIADMQEENRVVQDYTKLCAAAVVEFDGKKLTMPQLAPYLQSPDRAVRRAACEAQGNFYKSHAGELDDSFDKLVKIRTKMARKLGYDNFVELGYYRMTRNCYNPKDIAVFRQQIVDEIVPVVTALKKKQAERIGVDQLKLYDDALEFADGNATPDGTPEEMFEAGRRMYHELSKETGIFFDTMLEKDMFDVLSRDGKAMGGYCTFLQNMHCPFIFANFNGTSDDVEVLTHEAGHAYNDYVNRNSAVDENRCPTMESCEIHSMSMEFFTWPWMNLFFGEKADKYRYAHLEGTLFFLPYGAMVDHFQHIVYEQPDLTPAERRAEWQKLEKIYRPWLSFDGIPFFEDGGYWQRQHHIYEVPFYYIDYCLAQTVALEFWAAMQDDYADAWKRYNRLVSFGGTQTFRELVAAAGMKSPFEKGVYDDICRKATAWFDSREKEYNGFRS